MDGENLNFKSVTATNFRNTSISLKERTIFEAHVLEEQVRVHFGDELVEKVEKPVAVHYSIAYQVLKSNHLVKVIVCPLRICSRFHH